MPCARAHTLRISREVDFDVLTFEPVGREIASAEFVSETVTHLTHLQLADALVAVILGKNQCELQTLLRGGNNLSRIHEIRAVPDEDVNFSAWLRHAYADSCGQLIAHARTAKL